MSNYKNYRAGFNSKGLPAKRYADDPSKTERGKRRTRNKRHQHSYRSTSPQPSTSYDADRIQRESMYYCISPKTGPHSKGKICGCKIKSLGRDG